MASIIYNGAAMGFYSGDVLKLKEDLQVLKPTLFPSVPRLLNKFFDAMHKNINILPTRKKNLALKAIKTKLQTA
jgi:long-chain acyl-CoA synthetase